MKPTKKQWRSPTGITLTRQNKLKLAILARAYRCSRSEAVNAMIDQVKLSPEQQANYTQGCAQLDQGMAISDVLATIS